jgi:methionyl-tRNA formyltransferase
VAANVEVALVVTQPDRPAGRSRDLKPSPIKLLARELTLPLAQPERISDAAGLDLLRSAAPDLAVVVSYGQILREPVLGLPRLGCVNLHGSMLPRHRGASPIQSAILAGDETTGVTVIRMDAGVDTGPVVAAAAEPVRPRDTYETLHDRLAALGATLIVPAILALADGTLVPTAQDPARATRCRTIRKQDGRLDWSKPAVELDRAVRALNPWPGTFGTLDRRTGGPLELAILAAEPAAGRSGTAGPGSVTRAEGDDLQVACGSGSLLVRSARPAGRKAMSAAELLRGYGISAGDAFRPGTAS